jgi:hypothetical protein
VIVCRVEELCAHLDEIDFRSAFEDVFYRLENLFVCGTNWAEDYPDTTEFADFTYSYVYAFKPVEFFSGIAMDHALIGSSRAMLPVFHNTVIALSQNMSWYTARRTVAANLPILMGDYFNAYQNHFTYVDDKHALTKPTTDSDMKRKKTDDSAEGGAEGGAECGATKRFRVLS